MSCKLWKLSKTFFSKRYVPPITSTSPNLPETSDEIIIELKKQESLLNQIHAEMNTGYVSKKREEQLWEVQRIITQLKRKLRSFEKKQDVGHKSLDDAVDGDLSIIELNVRKTKSSCSDDESLKTMTILSTESTTNTETKTTPQPTPEITSIVEVKDNIDQSTVVTTPAQDPNIQQSNASIIYTDENGLMILPEDHSEYSNLLRLQFENRELANWKSHLQARIMAERAEILRLRESLHSINTTQAAIIPDRKTNLSDEENGNFIAHYLKENMMLQEKVNRLTREIFDENKELIELRARLALKHFQI